MGIYYAKLLWLNPMVMNVRSNANFGSLKTHGWFDGKEFGSPVALLHGKRVTHVSNSMAVPPTNIIWTVLDDSDPLHRYILKFRVNRTRHHLPIECTMEMWLGPHWQHLHHSNATSTLGHIFNREFNLTMGSAIMKVKYEDIWLEGMGFIFNVLIYLYVGPMMEIEASVTRFSCYSRNWGSVPKNQKRKRSKIHSYKRRNIAPVNFQIRELK